MPLEKIKAESNRCWALWKLEEDEQTLGDTLDSAEVLPDSITNQQKRLEWLGGRILIKAMMARLGLTYSGIVKDEFGKPFPKNSPYQLSLSHSYPYVAALMDAKGPVGIDLEQPKEKLLRIAPRVLHPRELLDAGDNVVKHCIYWCAKESLVKVYGKKDLTFAENLLISPFQQESCGDIVGRIIVDHHETMVPLYYRVLPNFVLVFSK
jgi:phosphopantetheinyl transferase